MDSNGAGEGLPEEVLFGRTASMQEIRQRVLKVCATPLPLLLEGESGTGKETLARFVHARSLYRAGQFVKVNCAAIPGPLLESELFGYQQGAFTGALTSKPGWVESAHQGTLFFDEIGDLAGALQAKLLQLLQDAQFSRIGDQEERHVDARVICATSRDLEQAVERGDFRTDLFYRIAVFHIRLPGLRDRRADVLALAEYLVRELSAKFQKEAPPLTPEIKEVLLAREWLGNIRELENWIARYVLLGPEGILAGETRMLRSPSPNYRPAQGGTIPLKHIAKDAIQRMEREVILRVLQENRWNRRRAAEALNISYRALIYKIREAGLSQKTSRKEDPELGEGAENRVPLGD